MKTIDKIIDKHDPWNDPFGYNKAQVKEIVIDALNQMIDYIANNVDADYTLINDEGEAFDPKSHIKVYVPKGQFEKIKELIK